MRRLAPILTLVLGAGCSGLDGHVEWLPYMDVPPYKDPAGFSSTYHRSLYGPISPGFAATPISKKPTQEERTADNEPGYLLTDERKEEMRDSLPGARFARTTKNGATK